MGFAEDMANLSENCITSFQNRKATVQRIHKDTNNFLRNCRNEHRNQAREDFKERRGFCQNLSREIQNQMRRYRRDFDEGHRIFMRAHFEIMRQCGRPLREFREFKPTPSRASPKQKGKSGHKRRKRH